MYVHVSGSELQGDSRVRILSGGRQLQISSAERTDASSYTCLASSAAGSAMKEYSLQVYGTWSVTTANTQTHHTNQLSFLY